MSKIYKVGGCVRDQLLGIAVHDEDFVVVGATEQEMLDKGFERVGADFPVFLHPQTKQEYALARQERKNGVGYLGFSTQTNGVSLEEDLLRRDLTVNAMALDCDTFEIIDPFNGQKDAKNKVLRHVSLAFCEDPVRVLRIGRFLAKFGEGWTVAPETLSLIAQMKQDKQLDDLVGERIWKEIVRGLNEKVPQQMLNFYLQNGIFDTKSMASAIGVRSEFFEKARANSSLFNFVLCFEVKQAASWVPKEFKQLCQKLDIMLKSDVDTAEQRVQLFDKIGGFKSVADVEFLLDVLRILQPEKAVILNKDVSALRGYNTKQLQLEGLDSFAIKQIVFNHKLACLGG